MLFSCVNLTSAAIRRPPHPTTRLSVSAQIFNRYLFFCNFNTVLSLSTPPPPPPFKCPNRIGCACYILLFCQIALYIMQALGSIFQATIAIRLVTTSHHAGMQGAKIRIRRSGSLLKVTARIRITKVTVWRTTIAHNSDLLHNNNSM